MTEELGVTKPGKREPGGNIDVPCPCRVPGARGGDLLELRTCCHHGMWLQAGHVFI